MLRFAARNGRHILILGLVAGLGLPGVASVLIHWVPQMVATLLFLNALRTGPRLVEGGGAGLGRAAAIALALQLALPLAAIVPLHASGLLAAPFAFAAVLMLAAPPITGVPNFAVMTGNDPAPAMRLLVVGTLLFPATTLAVLWGVPGIDGGEALRVTLRMAAILVGLVSGGMVARAVLVRAVPAATIDGVADGLSAILLGVLVIGLMAAVGPVLRTAPIELAAWVLGVSALNFALQLAALALGARARLPEANAISVCAGNRNIALYLLALPHANTDPILLFIGCYQIPMFLTPLLMRGLHARNRAVLDRS